MATTFQQVKDFMAAAGFSCSHDDEDEMTFVSFRCDADATTYRNEDGESKIEIVVQLCNKGESMAIFAPGVWSLEACEHPRAVCEAAARIQACMKYIRFDLGEDMDLQPNVEIPLYSAPLEAAQLKHSISCILYAVRKYDPVIRQAMQSGEVDLDLAVEDDAKTMPEDVTSILELAHEAGGIDALKKLLGGEP